MPSISATLKPLALKKPALPLKVDFMLGADPEIGFVDDGNKFVRADEVITDVGLASEFGLDGSKAVAELRPKPNKSPYGLVRNIKDALLSRRADCPAAYDVVWRSGSFVDAQPIGGHIHFGTKNLNECGVVFSPTQLLDCLNTYLACVVVLLESPAEAKARRSTCYGGLSDYRNQPHGIEYRSLSSWLTSPYIAAGVLALAKTVAWESIYNGLYDKMPLYPAGTTAKANDFARANTKPLKEFFLNQTWHEIQRFELYQQHKKAIDLIHFLISRGKNWFPDTTMQSSWGIRRFKAKRMPVRDLYEIWTTVPTEGLEIAA